MKNNEKHPSRTNAPNVTKTYIKSFENKKEPVIKMRA
jgi:hypothetical protein